MPLNARDIDHARELLPRTHFPVAQEGVVVHCAVSGGPDSMAMLFLAVASGLRPVAHHVDHGLRPGSAAEAQLVESLCNRLDLEFVSHRVQLVDGPNLEARARDSRRTCLPNGVLTGHTADDQAETILLNLMRGSGTEGLAGMRRSTSKPILGLRRHETHQLCRSAKISVATDESNLDPRFRRNRVRSELIPLLDDIADRDVTALVSRESTLIADDEDFLEKLAKNVDVHDALLLAATPLPLARRAIRMWLADPYPPDAATVERVLEVARGLHPSCEVGHGRRVARSRQRLELR